MARRYECSANPEHSVKITLGLRRFDFAGHSPRPLRHNPRWGRHMVDKGGPLRRRFK
jgi:hypothetical protein